MESWFSVGIASKLSLSGLFPLRYISPFFQMTLILTPMYLVLFFIKIPIMILFLYQKYCDCYFFLRHNYFIAFIIVIIRDASFQDLSTPIFFFFNWEDNKINMGWRVTVPSVQLAFLSAQVALFSFVFLGFYALEIINCRINDVLWFCYIHFYTSGSLRRTAFFHRPLWHPTNVIFVCNFYHYNY